MMKKLETFENAVGISFTDKGLLQRAFTHRSYINEHREENLRHNERLEFLGDAVLELVVTEYLFNTFNDKTEGDMTAYRAALVNTETLSSVATTVGMNDYLLLSKGEAKDTGRARHFILANTFEAFVGALYLDQGYAAAQGFIAKHLFPLTDKIIENSLWQDAKSKLQEVAQEKISITPVYNIVKEEGPDHDKHFTVAVMFGGEAVAEGSGKSKQEAEQDAARRALEEKGWA